MAVDGKSGQMIWELKEFSFINDLANEMNPILIDLYTVNVLRDLDGSFYYSTTKMCYSKYLNFRRRSFRHRGRSYR